MTYNKIKEEYPNLEEIPVIEIEVTFRENYFVKYDRIKFNFDEGFAISKPYKDENGNYKLKLKPVQEKPSAIFIGF